MKLIEVIVNQSYVEIASEIAKKHNTHMLWKEEQSAGNQWSLRMLVSPQDRQSLLDELQTHLQEHSNSKILVQSLEAVLPRTEETEDSTAKKDVNTTREELYNQIEKNAHLSGTFILLVILSTLVVTIGLLEDNVAVVIGAMVIAPLLGPNISLAFATALGDTALMWESLKTGAVGMGIALAISVCVGYVWPIEKLSHELLSRTVVGLDSVALALASGAAAVLSLTTGLSSVLVGVMVAVALLPPTTTIGLFLGKGQFDLAWGATLLLAVNIVSVNLSAKVAFLFRGIKPRTWLEKQKARQSMLTYILLWVLSLAILIIAITFR